MPDTIFHFLIIIIFFLSISFFYQKICTLYDVTNGVRRSNNQILYEKVVVVFLEIVHAVQAAVQMWNLAQFQFE